MRLQSAAYNGHIDVLQFLLERGADVNGATEDGVTALHFAALHRQHRVVQWLLKRGAEPCVATTGGCTPAHYALYAGDVGLAATLHEAAAAASA